MLIIDGSHGEGGGQVLRSSLSLSAVTGIPFRIHSIRKDRPKPGLRPQHLTGLLAMAEVCRAEVSGASVGSGEVEFSPRGTCPGEYFFDVSKAAGSAGSVTLVAQTLLPALSLASGGSRVTIRGGTHVAWSPSYEYFEDCFMSAAAKLGLDSAASIRARGYYPRGGGEITLRINPAGMFRSAKFVERGELLDIRGTSAVSNLAESIAQRQASAASRRLAEDGLSASLDVHEAASPGQGTSVYLRARFEDLAAGFGALGGRGKRAEVVGDEAASALSGYVKSGACVDEHLADQLVVYMALARGTSKMTVSSITAHLLTNIWVAGRFLPEVSFLVEGEEGSPGKVEVNAP